MERITTIAEMRAASRAARSRGEVVGLVPTMGALHRGHLSLVEEAAAASDLVVVSIFVNPVQFAPGEDLEAYPRDPEGDEARLRALGDAVPGIVFSPPVEEVYPGERYTTVRVARLTQILCGVSRPTHFDGVSTVVAKLFNIVEPDRAWFGRKDYQQLAIIRAMARDLDFPVEVRGGRTVREPDGVAMSSRNLYLDDDERRAARTLSQGLRRAVQAARDTRAAGRPPDVGMLRDLVRVTLDDDARVRVDYVDVRDAASLASPDEPSLVAADAAADDGTRGEDTDDSAATPPGDRYLVAVAAYIGAARLIDNVVIGDMEDEDALLAATGE